MRRGQFPRPHHALGADNLRKPLDALRDEVWAFDEVRCVAHDAGHEDQVVRDEVTLLVPDCPFVLVARIGRLERDLPDIRAEHRLQDVLELNVGRVWPCHEPQHRCSLICVNAR